MTVAPDGKLVPYEWETDDADYNPSLHDANFVVAGGPAPLPWAQSAALRTFGPSATGLQLRRLHRSWSGTPTC